MTNLTSAPRRSSSTVVSISSPRGLLFPTRKFTKLIMKNNKLGEYEYAKVFCLWSKVNGIVSSYV